MMDGYVAFLKKTFKRFRVNRVVHIGDLVDWYCLSYHEKNPLVIDGCKEVEDARKQIKQLAKAFPKADWMIGNHDALPFRKAKTAGLLPDLLKTYNQYWDINWKVHERRSKLIIDNVIYQHGDKRPGGKSSAIKHAMINFRSVVQGHHHTNAGVEVFRNDVATVFGMSVGCGMDVEKIQFEYGKEYAEDPVLGCGVVIEGKEAHFIPWN